MGNNSGTAEVVAAPNPVLRIVKSSLQQIFVFAALAITYPFSCFAAPNSAQFGVALDIIQQSAHVGVVALGATFVIATSGIDLSSGIGMTLVAVFAGIFLSGDWINPPLGGGLALILLVGALLSPVNGVNISFLGLPPFITTLAMMMAARGLALVLTNKSTISTKDPDYKWLAVGELISGVADAIPLFIIPAIIASVLPNKTFLGRYALAIGSNEGVTRLSSVNIKLWRTLVYVVAGIFVALGATLYSTCFGFIQLSKGIGFELHVIAAVVIGGTSLAGGRANVLGTVVGALIMETPRKGIQMMGAAQGWQLVVTGIAVLIAVFVDNVRRRRAATV